MLKRNACSQLPAAHFRLKMDLEDLLEGEFRRARHGSPSTAQIQNDIRLRSQDRTLENASVLRFEES